MSRPFWVNVYARPGTPSGRRELGNRCDSRMAACLVAGIVNPPIYRIKVTPKRYPAIRLDPHRVRGA